MKDKRILERREKKIKVDRAGMRDDKKTAEGQRETEKICQSIILQKKESTDTKK